MTSFLRANGLKRRFVVWFLADFRYLFGIFYLSLRVDHDYSPGEKPGKRAARDGLTVIFPEVGGPENRQGSDVL